MIPGAKIYNVQLVAEEIGLNILFPHAEEKLIMSLEYSQENQVTTIKIKYKGARIDIEKETDEIQKKFIDAAVNSIKGEIDSEFNVLTIEVK